MQMWSIRGLVLIAMWYLVSGASALAQGCSDAGICTMGSMRTGATTTAQQRSIYTSLSSSFGIGEQGVTILHAVPEVTLPLFDNGILRASIPLVRASGSLGTNEGIGDASINYTHSLYRDDDMEMGLTAGVRVATGTTNAQRSAGKALPMPYQTGLGTTDLVAGFSAIIDQWTLAAGYQRVVVDRNSNTYHDEDLGYFTSHQLRRGDDAMLRVSRRFQVGGVDLAPSVLAIYRVQGDRVMNVNVEGSRGLTLNVAFAAMTPISDRFTLRLDLASPIVVRQVRADGLTRAFVATLEMSYRL